MSTVMALMMYARVLVLRHAELVHGQPIVGRGLVEVHHAGLCAADVNMCSLIPDTTGAAVLFGGQIMTCGEAPPEEVIRTIARWAEAQPGTEARALTVWLGTGQPRFAS